LGPSFLKECDWAIAWAESFVTDCLTHNMLAGEANAAIKAAEITKRLTAEENRGHDKHFHYQDCIGFGLKVEMLEEDNELQDLVLTVHHCYMHSVNNSLALKIIENHLGRAQIKNGQSVQMPFFQFGGPPVISGPASNL
jgi:hypothetical protein